MKTNTRLLIMALYLITFGCIGVYGQPNKLKLPDESINMFTDRNIYIAGETIYFSAIISIRDNSKSNNLIKDGVFINSNTNFSDISYVELVTPFGERVSGGKYIISNLKSFGTLAIPKDVITGSYYLRAYTKYMRNKSPNSYCYLPLKIINPYKTEVLSTKEKEFSSSNWIELSPNSLQNILSYSANKTEYEKREKVSVEINQSKVIDKDIIWLCMAVVPEFSINHKSFNYETTEKIQKIDYYPENQGISLSGKLIDNLSNNALPFTNVNLSIVGMERDFSTVCSDSFGRFFFSLPKLIGDRDLFLSTAYLKESKPTIFIDNDFCKMKVNLPSTIFQLSNEEKNIGLNLAMNFQVAQLFSISKQKDIIQKDIKPFYGNPTNVLIFEKYIQLPTIEDYINELLSFLKVKKSHGNKSLRIYSTEADMYINEPLILLDLAAIDDPNKILALSPQNISRIELVSAPYVRGNITYGGIISFFSKKGDYAGIDLPSSGVFLNFNFLANSSTFPITDYYPENYPDTRNTLYWNPNIDIEKDNEISFQTSDTPGKYDVLLRGMRANGELFYCLSTFSVK